METVKPTSTYINESRAKQLLTKWAPVLDYKSEKVRPLTESNARLNTAILLENQEQWCTEAVAGGSGSVFGSGVTGTEGSFSGDRYATGDARLPKVLIPMIRRTFPELITNEIVGVQPMSGPVGLAFALRYYYEGTALGAYSPDGSTTANVANPAWAASNGKEIGYNYLDTRYSGTSSGQLSSGVADFAMLGTDQGVAALLKNFEISSNIPQATIQFVKSAVEAGTRRLAARWSVELEQDLKNMNGIDVDNELTNAMSYEIQSEIDREMVMRMVTICLQAGQNKGYSFWSPVSADGRWFQERNRHLYQKVLVESNRVAVRNRRGAANFIVATPTVCAIFEALPGFQYAPVTGTVNTNQVGVAKVGTLAGRFNVYRDTRTEAQFQTGERTAQLDYILLGYKGSEFYDSGIIYCPYVPVMVQRTIGPNDFAPRVGLLTRYGVLDHLFGANLYYHTIIVKNLNASFAPGTAAVYGPDQFL